MPKTKKKDNLDFEISFFERLLEYKPTFVQALVALGDAYTKKGLYEKGLEIDKRLVQLKPKDDIVYYNLACDYSLLEQTEQSLQALAQALQLGYRDFSFMEKDPDLAYTRKDARYRQLLSRYKKSRL